MSGPHVRRQNSERAVLVARIGAQLVIHRRAGGGVLVGLKAGEQQVDLPGGDLSCMIWVGVSPKWRRSR
jgi:hypothetical protein